MCNRSRRPKQDFPCEPTFDDIVLMCAIERPDVDIDTWEVIARHVLTESLLSGLPADMLAWIVIGSRRKILEDAETARHQAYRDTFKVQPRKLRSAPYGHTMPADVAAGYPASLIPNYKHQGTSQRIS